MEKPTIEIEYCIKCKWLIRATWISQELLQTFSNELNSIKLIPSHISGIFEIRCNRKLVWERNKKEGTPKIKLLKQQIRDIIAPEKNLGHIDN